MEKTGIDSSIPYLMLAYREVPQDSTRFPPFELVHGQHVRGPLDVLKDQGSPVRSLESIISYVVTMLKKLARMTMRAKENLMGAQHV